MSALNQYWVDNRDWYMGLNHDVTQNGMFALYVDPENPCSVVLMTYPGRHIEFDNYDENGCLDIRKEYPALFDDYEWNSDFKYKPQTSPGASFSWIDGRSFYTFEKLNSDTTGDGSCVGLLQRK